MSCGWVNGFDFAEELLEGGGWFMGRDWWGGGLGLMVRFCGGQVVVMARGGLGCGAPFGGGFWWWTEICWEVEGGFMRERRNFEN